ncbi:FtsX-like permease family protein [Candidatus Binatia bacterium]|nr:FtsX-like permease family protein [Candidatus Binatia bacterium]
MFAMISALRQISLRHLRHHKLRTVLTVLGIALGVSAIVAIRLVNEIAARSFEQSVAAVAGATALQITNGDAGVPEELVDEVKAVRGIGTVAPTVQGFVTLPDLPGERVYLLGVDLLADRDVREYQPDPDAVRVDDPLVFLAKANSIALTRELMAAHALSEGQTMRVQSGSGVQELVIRATIDGRTGPSRLFGGRVAVMDVFAAQRLFAQRGRFTQIDVAQSPTRSTEELQQELTALTAGRAIVERPQRRGETLERLLAGNRSAFTLGAALANVLGLYIVFNAMMVAVTQRRREIAILRSTGMRGREVIRLVMLEALLLGAAGCALGIPLGNLFARTLWSSYRTSVSDRFLPIEQIDVTLTASAVLWGVAFALLTSLVGALVPTRQAIRVRPIEALRNTVAIDAVKPIATRLTLAALALLAARTTAGLLQARRPDGPFATARQVLDLGLLVVVSLGAPALLRRVLRLLVRHDDRLGGVTTIASRNVLSHFRRVSTTSSALLVSIAGAIGVATVASSFEATFRRVLAAEFGRTDVGVSSGTQVGPASAKPLPDSLVDLIAALPEVQNVDPSRWVKVPYGGLLTYVVARDTRVYRVGYRGLNLVDGDRDAALDALEAGRGAIVSEVFARRFHKGRGDVLELPTPSGPVALEIVAVHSDLTDLGAIYVDRAAYRRLWRDDKVTFIELSIATGASRDAVMNTIRSRWGESYGLFVVPVATLVREYERIAAQALFAIYPVILIVIAIALLGLVNALLAAVLEGVRQMGILRAIGATRRQLALSFMVEAALIGAVGGVAGVLTGALVGYVWVGEIPELFGMSFTHRYPLGAMLVGGIATVVLAAAAGWIPGRAAGNLNVRSALAYE